MRCRVLVQSVSTVATVVLGAVTTGLYDSGISRGCAWWFDSLGQEIAVSLLVGREVTEGLTASWTVKWLRCNCRQRGSGERGRELVEQ